MTGGNLPQAPAASTCFKIYTELRDDCDSVIRVERWPGKKPHIWIQCYGYSYGSAEGEVPFLSPRQARRIAAALLKFANDKKAYRVPSNEVVLKFDPPWGLEADVSVEAAGKKLYKFRAHTPKAKAWLTKNKLNAPFTLARKYAYDLMARMKESGLFVVGGYM
jgi:hypothetical protein